MKGRILLLVACLMMVLSSSCLAANWVWVTSDSRMGFFFDSDSIKVYETEGKPETRRITFWSKIIFDDAFAEKQGILNGQTVHMIKDHATFAPSKMAQTTHAKYIYSKDGNLLDSKPHLNINEPIIPGSFGEKILQSLEKYIAEHNIKPQK